MNEGRKYQPLPEFLHDSNQDEVTLTFAEIETLMNDTLPDSARSKRAGWSNRSKGALQLNSPDSSRLKKRDRSFSLPTLKLHLPLLSQKAAHVLPQIHSRKGLQ